MYGACMCVGLDFGRGAEGLQSQGGRWGTPCEPGTWLGRRGPFRVHAISRVLTRGPVFEAFGPPFSRNFTLIHAFSRSPFCAELYTTTKTQPPEQENISNYARNDGVPRLTESGKA